MYSAGLALAVLAGCSAQLSDGAQDGVSESRAELRASDAGALARGTRETLVTGIVSAENQLFSAAGRLYVSGDDGVFELRRTSAAAPVTATRLVHVDGCRFGGLSERKATLYALCYDGTRSYLYAAPESATPVFARIYELADILLANGMATDGTSLYVTATGQGTILRLSIDPANPLRITAREPFLAYSRGLLPNGIKISGGSVYWGDFGTIHRASLDNPAIAASPISAFTFFDDLWISERVVLVADYLFGSVQAYSTSGTYLGGTPFGVFGNPSSVSEAKGRLGLGARDLVVTEKGSGSVAVFHY